jgi:hypothetical protein
MTSPGRYHLLLTTRGLPVQRGWWGLEGTGREKFRRWVGEYSGLPDARISDRRGERHRAGFLA